jgi:hypothetical protein
MIKIRIFMLRTFEVNKGRIRSKRKTRNEEGDEEKKYNDED